LHLLLLCLSALAADRPTVGAIRWDAWSGGGVTTQVEQTLAPSQYRARLPWFAEVDEKGHAHIDGSAPGVMEQEIAYAHGAGLDYWAFLTYPADDAMSSALSRYLASPRWSFTLSAATQHTRVMGPDKSFAYIPAYVAQVAPAEAYGGAYVVYAFNGLPGRSGDYEYTLIPHAVGSLYASYTGAAHGYGRAGVTAGVSYASRTAGTVQNAVRYPAYALMNLSAFLDRGDWTAQANIDNLFDALYFTPDADVYANLGAVPGRGRAWRLSLKRRF
jgi:hypothetical protein